MGLEAFSLAGKHVVVVGASSGIGKATAIRCAEAGAIVSVAARRVELLSQLVAELPGSGHGFHMLDVRVSRSIPPCLDVFVKRAGPIGGLVYSAGVSTLLPLNVTGEDHWRGVLDVNLTGAVFCTKEAVSAKRCSPEGMGIVWISSSAAQNPAGAGRLSYGASKAGMIGAARALANELSRRRMRINVLCPAAVATEIWDKQTLDEQQKRKFFDRHPLGIGEPDDIAYACVYLLSPAARWLTGTVISLDGGFSVT